MMLTAQGRKVNVAEGTERQVLPPLAMTGDGEHFFALLLGTVLMEARLSGPFGNTHLRRS